MIYCAAVGGGIVLGLVIVAVAFRVSERFDRQLIHF